MPKANKPSKTIVTMYHCAKRVETVEEYYFSRKLKEVAAMRAQGIDVISLGIGSPDMPPSAATIETLCHTAQQPDVHGYQPYTGIPELRQAYADFYAQKYKSFSHNQLPKYISILLQIIILVN